MIRRSLLPILLAVPLVAQSPAPFGTWTLATAPDLAGARERIEAAIERVRWPGMQVRHDIGLRALNHARAGRMVTDPFD